ncbi:hypothetical protein PVK06_021165 [Gossypium arboreum]|uniref:Uncharacterized protein n=1 Tax=Gossypium arboreum TaxID=29729 RepID=A0ABR0PP90_GOSAR|nr:hypothetical protein PVK06_021165 [Gossypium arboreum]
MVDSLIMWKMKRNCSWNPSQATKPGSHGEFGRTFVANNVEGKGGARIVCWSLSGGGGCRLSSAAFERGQQAKVEDQSSAPPCGISLLDG